MVKTAEIKLAAFFAENNVAFQLVNKLIPLLKEIFNDSNIAQKCNYTDINVLPL